MSELVVKRKTFFYENPEGGVDIFDAESGELVESLGTKPFEHIKKNPFKYNEVMADIICQKVAEGKTLLGLCETGEFPSYSIICRWRRQYPEFETSLEQARKDRAELMAEKVVWAAEEATDKDNAPAAKVKMEAYKWSAQAFNPNKFSPKTRLSDAEGGILTMILDTGVRRRGDAGYVDNFPKEVNPPVMDQLHESSKPIKDKASITPNPILGGLHGKTQQDQKEGQEKNSPENEKEGQKEKV